MLPLVKKKQFLGFIKMVKILMKYKRNSYLCFRMMSYVLMLLLLEVIFLLNVFLIEHKKDRNAKVENIFKYDKREAKKVSP